MNPRPKNPTPSHATAGRASRIKIHYVVCCLILAACSRNDANALKIDVTKIDKGGISRLNNQYIVVNVSNAENGGVTEVYRTMVLSKAHKSDSRFAGELIKFDRVESDGTAVFLIHTDIDHELRAKGGEVPHSSDGSHFGFLIVHWASFEKQETNVGYLSFTSAARQ